MFTWLAQQWTNVQLRAQLAWMSLEDATAWAQRQLRHVQYGIICMLANTMLCTFLSWWFASHTPAVVGMATTYLIYLYIVRKLAWPIWQVEIALALWRSATSVLPAWARRWVVTQPTPTASTGHTAPSVVWHEASVGGNVFHVISTIFMWSETLLYTCAILPAWLMMGPVVANVIMILFFVATEDFVDIKKWRARLAWVVGIETVLFVLIPLLLYAVAPGTYRSYRASWGYEQMKDDVEAETVEAQTVADRSELRMLRSNVQACDKQKRAFERNEAGIIWTDQDELRCDKYKSQIEDIEAGNDEEGESSTLLTLLHPIYMGAMGFGLVIIGLLVSPFMKGRS
ncbi:MAG: hypothetical protein KW804_00810 [Candidatus Doudnabacteria bacterium]|nr:hypothetical protein [Candidatus Doudnabacteria bacterium]